MDIRAIICWYLYRYFFLTAFVDTKVEIQIRTIAMDFWASLEHKIYYKFEGDAPEYISRDLRECAEMVSTLDEKMLSLNEAIKECLEKQEELNISTKTKETNRQDQRFCRAWINIWAFNIEFIYKGMVILRFSI